MVRFALAILFSCGLVAVANAETYTPGEKINKDFDGFARAFLTAHCVDCHGESEPEGGLSLTELGPVDEVNASTWTSVWAQVALKEMPPKDADQPGVVERLQFSDWIVGELTRVMRDKGGFSLHRDPNKGNFVDHDLSTEGERLATQAVDIRAVAERTRESGMRLKRQRIQIETEFYRLVEQKRQLLDLVYQMDGILQRLRDREQQLINQGAVSSEPTPAGDSTST